MSTKNKKKIEDLISKEENYFKPMIERQGRYSKDELDAFRKESVHERRARISDEIYELSDGRIKYGQFKGLKLQKKTWWGGSDLGSMCLGLYEKEILNLLSSEIFLERNIFIDIGAADGYYAIGMLHANLADSAICYELTQEGRNTIEENWKNNESPGNLEIYGDIFQDFHRGLDGVDLSKAITLIDIEGAEFDFLTKENLSMLSKSFIIIEIHNWVDSFMEKYTELLNNASDFFEIEMIEREERPTVHLSEVRSLTDDNRLLLTSEARPCLMRFLLLKPLSVAH